MIASATVFVSTVATLASSTDPGTGATRIPDPDTVSPGFSGFLAIFVVAVATVLLIRSMTKHIRKVKFLSDERDRNELAALDPDQPAGAAPVASGSSAPTGPGQAPRQL